MCRWKMSSSPKRKWCSNNNGTLGAVFNFMAHSLFISDLHLCVEQPRSTQVFLHFMQHRAPEAEALYILGDLFEYWAGDDALGDPFHRQIIGALHTLAACGTRVFIMHGNRDLLMGKNLEQVSDATLLPDPVLLDLYGTATLLTHGDLLCTDDTAYQEYRKQVHDPTWQQQFLAQPLIQRKAFIGQLRARSENEKTNQKQRHHGRQYRCSRQPATGASLPAPDPWPYPQAQAPFAYGRWQHLRALGTGGLARHRECLALRCSGMQTGNDYS